MPETNGRGRLDRIEAILDRVAAHQLAMQEQHERDFKQLMTWQVLAQDRMDRVDHKFDAFLERVDGIAERIDKLVVGIGEVIQRLPGRSSPLRWVAAVCACTSRSR